tara:strand:+ start:1333 stop:1731 length:399 start_codon:yes stop_codon:yes gene_type:complete
MIFRTNKFISILKIVSTYAMSIGYVTVGLGHFTNTSFFLKIMPPYLPYHTELVYLSGLFEIILGFGLLFKSFKKWVGWGLIFLLIAVYPANIYLAFNKAPQEAINITPFLASWVRLPMQFIFITLAYIHAKS